MKASAKISSALCLVCISFSANSSPVPNQELLAKYKYQQAKCNNIQSQEIRDECLGKLSVALRKEMVTRQKEVLNSMGKTLEMKDALKNRDKVNEDSKDKDPRW
ncbi:hypothetical protein [Thiomicrorhabdus aquaedulcis]|uniref:hypothetical protein n=1 Tax=Thiomicrorhabdus aquaedulcis TaxID=2211106 RepID=UPI000FDA7E07|nr:hypothetical protein [Thiomicrorhabdus aquaedulcis]